jgi:hypothetical protein
MHGANMNIVLQELLPVGCGDHAKLPIRYWGNKPQFWHTVHISVQIGHLTLRGFSQSPALKRASPVSIPGHFFCGIYGVQGGTVTGFSPGTYTLHFQYHYTKAKLDARSLTYYQINIILQTDRVFMQQTWRFAWRSVRTCLSDHVLSRSVFISVRKATAAVETNDTAANCQITWALVDSPKM